MCWWGALRGLKGKIWLKSIAMPPEIDAVNCKSFWAQFKVCGHSFRFLAKYFLIHAVVVGLLFLGGGGNLF